MNEDPNEILENDISLTPDNSPTDTTYAPNEEISMDDDADGDELATTSTNGEILEDMISDNTGDIPVSPDLTDPQTEKDSGDIPAVTVQTETDQGTCSLDDIYQSLERSREIQAETLKTSSYGNKLLEITNSIGISLIFTVALVLGVLIGRVVWRKI